jgi:iron complex outermembrane recepter protein
MRETKNMRCTRKGIRWQLLVTVSAAALLASVYTAGEAEAADSDRPPLWIEVGGQLDRLSDAQEQLAPPFLNSITQANLVSALDVQRPPLYSIAEEAKISFQPKDADWVFSAAIQYGRSRAARDHHQQTANKKVPVRLNFPPPFNVFDKYYSFYPNRHAKFADATEQQSEAHAVLDFMAGKDVGLGMFGGHGSSVISAGVRIAQFTSQKNVTLRAEPDVQYPTRPITTVGAFGSWQYANYSTIRLHDYAAMLREQRSFRGVGPSIAWDASVPIAGNSDSGEITVDWGANAAILFGRQKASGTHDTNARSYYGNHWYGSITGATKQFHPGGFISGFYGAYRHVKNLYDHAGSFNRMRNVVVPNLGGTIGLSFLYADAKVSFGYRADFFFGAIDGGIDTRKSENRGFFGPFASISVGLGD